MTRARVSIIGLLALLSVAPLATLLGQAAVPEIVFESPVEEGYVSGPSQVRIRLEPASSAVRSVTLVADGTQLCTVDRPPFECAWDAGPRVSAHVIRASVLLANGRRLSRLIKTKRMAYTENVDVDVVRVTATVTDRNGQFIRGLTGKDFRVYEDNVAQRVTTFRSEDVPLDIVVAMDVSGSMKPSMPTVKMAVGKFLSALRPADRVTVLTFNDTVFTVAKPTDDLAARLRAINRMTAWGDTALYEVIVKAIDQLQLGTEAGRRVLVVFTDGEDISSRIPVEVVEGRLETSDAVLYAIGEGRAPKVPMLKQLLERLAEKSGGRAFFEDVKDLDRVFARLVAELSNQYLLGYERRDSARDSRWRKLRVEVPGRGFTVRHRRGYRVVQE